MLADGEQVGQQLAGMEVVRERVDDRNRGSGGHLFQPRLREGAPDDGGNLPLKHAGSVRWGLLASQLAALDAEDEGYSPEVGDAGGERDPRARGRLVEDDGDGLRT